MARHLAPRGLIVAAPGSGAGKTMVALGLITALTQAGQKVRPFKVGPDYIDPTYLSAAAGGQVCANLDPWAMREEMLASLVGTVAEEEIAIVEGVMGLHDGPGSTAALAQRTGWPILLVIDASNSAQTAAALAEGLALRDPQLTFAGVLFNKVASPRHESLIRAGLRSQMPCWFLPPISDLTLPSRHLGLHRASDHKDLQGFLTQAGKWAAPALGAVKLARSTLLPTQPHQLQAAKIPFAEFGLTFAYPHLNLPPDALFLPGGYPELYLGAIQADPHFLPNLKQAAASGRPIYGECGGFMVLGAAIIDAAGIRHDMAGLLPLVTTFADQKLQLGYREMELRFDCACGVQGERWRGHEFHYTQAAWQGAAAPLFQAWDAYGQDLGPQGLKVGSVAGSYLHLIDKVA